MCQIKSQRSRKGNKSKLLIDIFELGISSNSKLSETVKRGGKVFLWMDNCGMH